MKAIRGLKLEEATIKVTGYEEKNIKTGYPICNMP